MMTTEQTDFDFANALTFMKMGKTVGKRDMPDTTFRLVESSIGMFTGDADHGWWEYYPSSSHLLSADWYLVGD